jgi:hypothetical protein
MRSGLTALSAAWPKPSLSIAPGRKFSVTMSAVAMSLSTAAFAAGSFTSMARLFLLRLNAA